ncbi:type II toxin-antitoxin system YafQ family toxin [Candidatus Electronema sp. JC]|uniref:type II toxin-antitoxin system RelE/ParE family toxin n=1 Tax=Candidatus Electronema sp. JC TaxID=3401570 RepID=UPI003B43B0FD
MNRPLLKSSAFARSAKQLLKKKPHLAASLRTALEMLTADAFHPALKTHKLKGNLEGSWACSVAYDLRIVFSFVEESGNEAILLEAVGTHDEVY